MIEIFDFGYRSCFRRGSRYPREDEDTTQTLVPNQNRDEPRAFRRSKVSTGWPYHWRHEFGGPTNRGLPEYLNAVATQMRDSTDRDRTILRAIAENDRLTQRHLARELGVAVSLANPYLRRLALKGFIRIINVRPNRLRSLLTPKGGCREVSFDLCLHFQIVRAISRSP